MVDRTRSNGWFVHVVVALAYALSFALLRQLSFSHWVIFAGLRLSALLLVPYRYWGALAIGEAGPLAYAGIMHVGEFGFSWALAYSVPPIAVAMPLVYGCRARSRIFSARSGITINMGALLLCTLLLSVVWTLVNMATMSITILPKGYPSLDYSVLASRWFIGNYLGVLTLTPLLLFLRELWLIAPSQRSWINVLKSRLLVETAAIVLPALALLVWLGLDASYNTQQAARMAMFLPVVWLALRHGWQGAALGGTAASFAVVLTMPERYDASTLQAQVFIAFAITTMLMLGAKIAQLNVRGEKDREQAKRTLVLAQQAVYLGEVQLRQTSYALEQVRESVHTSYDHMLDRLQFLLPKFDEREYRRVSAAAQQQMFALADGMHPLLGRDAGLSESLREGLIARTMDECGMRFWCDVSGNQASVLSPSLQIALYRLACEGVACACEEPDVSEIWLHLRSGTFDGRHWAFLRIDGNREVGRARRLQHKEMLIRLSASGMGLDALRARVAIFEGKLKVRSSDTRKRIALILHDPG